MNTTRIILTLGALIISQPDTAWSQPPWSGFHAAPPCCAMADTNRDGIVTREELTTLRAAHFAGADRNQDGYLTPDELSGLPGRHPRMGRHLYRMDRDGDGRISREEFLAFVPPRWAGNRQGWRPGIPPGGQQGAWAR